MDCLKLIETSNYFGYNGVCISNEKAYLLQNSLLILQEENHFQKTFYWGRINGVQKDYHVAYGYEKDCLNDQNFFYSLDCIEWLLMPKPEKRGRFLASLAGTAFEGDPTIMTNVYNANPALPPNEDHSKLFEGPVPQELKEEDRLACIIELINEDAMIVPRGAWFKRPNGQIVENVSFEGLNETEAACEKSYLHGRAPQQKWNTNLLTRPDYNYAIDFLDSIDTDLPQGCWNLQIHQSGRLAILQSLYWPGMNFFHKINSPHYGSLYVGHGMKNMDVPFMI